MKQTVFPLKLVAAAVEEGRATWRAHVLRRMLERGVSRAEVAVTLRDGEVIEDYPDDHPYPSALVLGYCADRPLHVVVAFDSAASDAYIITVYEPSPDKFEPDWRTRRTT